MIERAVALADSDLLQLDDLPPALLDGYTEVLVPSFRRFESMRAWGSRYARMVLERCENNKRQACRELGISYHTLQAYLRFRPQEAANRPTVSGLSGERSPPSRRALRDDNLSADAAAPRPAMP